MRPKFSSPLSTKKKRLTEAFAAVDLRRIIISITRPHSGNRQTVRLSEPVGLIKIKITSTKIYVLLKAHYISKAIDFFIRPSERDSRITNVIYNLNNDLYKKVIQIAYLNFFTRDTAATRVIKKPSAS